MERLARECLEERQLSHLFSLDNAYESGFACLERVACAASQPLVESQGAYSAYRRLLLRSKLYEASRRYVPSDPTSTYPSGNRFLLPPVCGPLEEGTPVGTCTAVTHASPTPTPTYASWRRALLARRFEYRRMQEESGMLKRMAAEAVGKAMAAELAAREEYEGMQQEKAATATATAMASAASPGSPSVPPPATGPQAAHRHLRDRGVWSAVGRFKCADVLSRPGALDALVGLGVSGAQTAREVAEGGRDVAVALAAARGPTSRRDGAAREVRIAEEVVRQAQEEARRAGLDSLGGAGKGGAAAFAAKFGKNLLAGVGLGGGPRPTFTLGRLLPWPVRNCGRQSMCWGQLRGRCPGHWRVWPLPKPVHPCAPWWGR